MKHYYVACRSLRQHLFCELILNHQIRNKEEGQNASVNEAPILIFNHSLSNEVNHERGLQLERQSPYWYGPSVVSIPSVEHRVIAQIEKCFVFDSLKAIDAFVVSFVVKSHLQDKVIEGHCYPDRYHQPQISSEGSASDTSVFPYFEEPQGEHKSTQNEEHHDPEVSMVDNWKGERFGPLR